VVPCEQFGDREVGLVAVEVEQLSMTADAAGVFVWQCHLEVMESTLWYWPDIDEWLRVTGQLK
jgi:hypothetical protein